MTEQELLSAFDKAIKAGDLFVCYQPKTNHSTGRMIGAEALMRWRDPTYGMQYPSDFIPVLENHDLIYQADIAVFEQVCKFLRKCIDDGLPAVPISCNMSRYDIYHHDYIDRIEEIRAGYGIPVNLLHIEVTESSAIGGTEMVMQVLDKLHGFGYKVEMDDFGSGYSSLNILKDLAVDVIKLDMRFFSGSPNSRGGAIINAVVQMSNWLNTPVIAEGVETLSQADYMKSIGCFYIQGYLYSKPVEEEEFVQKLNSFGHEPLANAIDLDRMDANKFWNPNSLETLIFNNYVGGAAIFSYFHGKVELLRVNQKYMKELGMNMTEQEVLKSDLLKTLGLDDRRVYEETLHRAIQSNDEESCETWRELCSKVCGSEKVCIRSFIRLLGKAGERYLFYTMIQNITAEKRYIENLELSEKRFRYVNEHIQGFAWEYEIATKRMRPCSRCRRVLGLPEVIENYPQPLYDSGLFQPDYQEMYNDWMDKIAQGVPYLEADMPLTNDRIMFTVRYTTEFDEAGKPLKAYGTATPCPAKDNN